MTTEDPAELLDAARRGDRRQLARLLSVVERGGDDARIVDSTVWRDGGAAYTVGITGAPGSGKSTITSALITRIRHDGERVAVIAVDPTSPFSGGAILGDRVRMGDHIADDGVFIRSMATRGHLGGLALAVPAAARVLDAAGYPWIVLETVGVGQVEVEVAQSADTTVVVVNPGWGDAVQAAKAGLMEIADVFVVNKADRDGVPQARQDLQAMLELAPAGGWQPPIVETVATDGRGVDELYRAIRDHRAHARQSGERDARRVRRVRRELRQLVATRFEARAAQATADERFDATVAEVTARRIDPQSAAAQLAGE